MKGLLIMKLAVRIFALSVVIAGAAAASLSSSTTHAVRSHQSATDTLPVPMCGPHIPTCPAQPGSNAQ
jgi:flagellar basal body-associated protein FliL